MLMFEGVDFLCQFLDFSFQAVNFGGLGGVGAASVVGRRIGAVGCGCWQGELNAGDRGGGHGCDGEFFEFSLYCSHFNFCLIGF